MDTAKQFKNSPELRKYWREHKAKERAAKNLGEKEGF